LIRLAVFQARGGALMKLHQNGTVSFLIKLAVFQASGAAYVKLRLAGTANRLNVEHRTSNIERRILMALRFIESKTSESQNLEGWFCFAQPFIN
jgi:hypothetical protein